MMRYWTIVTPTSAEDNTTIYETLSDDEIIEQYWDYWSSRMIAKYGGEEFQKSWCNKQDCIDDWVAIHWAVESD
jgi:hypothetical protein